MSGLAVATAARSGAARVAVANRTRAKAERLAAGVGGEVADFADLAGAIAAADLVISCTGAGGLVITEHIARAALAAREGRAARWSCSTWPCRGTSIQPPPRSLA